MIDLYCSHGTGDQVHLIAKVDPQRPTRPDRDQRRDFTYEYSHDDREGTHDPLYSGGAVTFYCTECRRSPQVAPDRLEDIITKAAAAGLTRLDVSGYPFSS